ncbi:hypothetical protein AAWM_03346 [Aspergillus awamori]|uniref:CBD9-like protein n=2 Tax=Aspergillus TaxID=5052 RepID=A0A3F3QAB2_9EURO|nr:CBD9-like protein [Aspergillus welwitschiae]RDH36055.1 CBD9-like protein [Aspergillus welwitschiae]GCB20461.1 hypothetical protein AAWM_03346 [Aspergillus awamori]GKZ57851.1 hypothetical protein AnigIFM49718_003192 [Aspergillus niger]
MQLFRLLPAVALGSALATADIVTYSPPTEPGLSYSVTIPNTTAAAGSGPIYLQISAPTTLQWVSLGEGAQMASANLFILWAASPTDVTLSPRSSLDGGQSEPQYNSHANVTLLPGSGIDNGVMIANIRCDNCLSAWPTPAAPSSDPSSTYTLDPEGASTPWFWASYTGPPLNNPDPSADLAMHDDLGSMQLDLSRAQFSVSGAMADPSYNPFQ